MSKSIYRLSHIQLDSSLYFRRAIAYLSCRFFAEFFWRNKLCEQRLLRNAVDQSCLILRNCANGIYLFQICCKSFVKREPFNFKRCFLLGPNQRYIYFNISMSMVLTSFIPCGITDYKIFTQKCSSKQKDWLRCLYSWYHLEQCSVGSLCSRE